MTVTTLFRRWQSQHATLAINGLADQHVERLADHIQDAVVAMSRMPAADLPELLLKLKVYGFEGRAGLGHECDLLLISIMQDLALLYGEPGEPPLAELEEPIRHHL